MKAPKFAEAQKAFILKQGEEGTPVAEISRTERVREILSSASPRRCVFQLHTGPSW